MRNLAGNEKADGYIQEELFVAGVDLVEHEEGRVPGEVPTKYMGKLGPFTFRRAWYYWVVKGNVPLAAAEEMWAQIPYGRRDVRVAGMAGGCPPEYPWVEFYAEDGKRVCLLGEHDRELFNKYDAGELTSEILLETVECVRSDNHFVESLEELKARATRMAVPCYHIDSQAGLKVFVDTVRKHGLCR